MATVFQSSSRIRIFFEKYPEKYCRISNIQQKPIIFFEDHEFRNNSEFSEHRSSCSEISLRKSPFRCASLLPRSFSERNIESPLQGQQMAQLARARCASGEVDWEDACPHSAGSETPSEKRTGSKRFRENCEECVSSETCSTHSLEQTSSPRASPFQHPPFRGPLYVLLDGGAPDLTVAAPVSRRLVALARLVPPCQDDPLEGQR